MNSRSHSQFISIELIDAPAQVRDRLDEEPVRGLSGNILTQGLLNPITVQRVGQRYRVVCGLRRFEACKLAGMSQIEAQVIDAELTPAETLLMQLSENRFRQDLDPIMYARAIEEYKSLTGASSTEIAKHLGESDRKLSDWKKTLSLPVEIQEQVRSEAIPLSCAVLLADVTDPQRQRELADRVATRKLTRDRLQQLLRNEFPPEVTPEEKPGTTRRATARLGEGRSVTVNGSDLTLDSFITLLEELLGKARKVRPRGIELNTFLRMLKEETQC